MNFRHISIEEIEDTAGKYKEDLQRDTNRYIRQQRPERAAIALEAMEVIDRFVYQLRITAGSQLNVPRDKTRGKKPIEISSAVRRYARKLM